MAIGATHSPTPSDEFPAGTVFAGKYCVERVIGRGGMGAVLAARHMDLGHRVAIKVLHESLASDPRATERFQREARASVRLESEHVAHVSDVGTDHGTSYMTMEYLEGEDLASVLKTRGRIAQQEAVSWILQACDAVAEAHSQGIIHRDLKPANLFLARRKRGLPQIKVLDFGISKTTIKSRDHGLQDELTETQAIVGTPHYASPEQLRGDQGLDARSDIWSLGILLHRLLSGGRPFEAETSSGLIAAIAADPPTPVRTVAPDVSPEVEGIILRCLEKKPCDRYGNVAELAGALEAFAAPELQGMVRHIEKLSQSVFPEPSTRRQKVTPALSLQELLSRSGNGSHTVETSVRRETTLPTPLLMLVGGIAAASAVSVVVLQARDRWQPDPPVLSTPSRESVAANIPAAIQKPERDGGKILELIAVPPSTKPAETHTPSPAVTVTMKAVPTAQTPPPASSTTTPRSSTTPSSSSTTPHSSTTKLRNSVIKPSTIIESDPYANH